MVLDPWYRIIIFAILALCVLALFFVVHYMALWYEDLITISVEPDNWRVVLWHAYTFIIGRMARR